MKLMFVYWAFEDQGSGLIIQGYAEAARKLGYDVVVYGRPNPRIPLNYSLDVGAADALILIFEWTTQLLQGDSLDWVRLMERVPRRRRVIIDGDGNYNDLVHLEGDYNHRDAASARRWVEICDSLSDKIVQPTLHPLRPNVRSFLFYSYNPAWERPLDGRAKEFALLYVGHSKFRWRPMQRILKAIEPIRDRVGRIGVVGHGWGQLPPWAVPMQMEDAYYTDADYLQNQRVELLPPIPFSQVVDCMSRAVFNPVISRPTFTRMQLVTPRFFETPAANTIPLFGLDASYVREIYGEEGLALVLPEDRPEDKILDILGRPEHYASVVRSIRRRLTKNHSQEVRLRELLAILDS